MLLLPVRVEDAEVDRLPASPSASRWHARSCSCSPGSCPKSGRVPHRRFPRDRALLQEHPYLELQPRFLYDYLSPRARESLEELREDQPVTVDAETLAIEQRHLDSLIEGFEAEAEGSLLRRLGLVPRAGSSSPAG